MKRLILLLITYLFLVAIEPKVKYMEFKNMAQKFLQSIYKVKISRKKLMRISSNKNYTKELENGNSPFPR